MPHERKFTLEIFPFDHRSDEDGTIHSIRRRNEFTVWRPTAETTDGDEHLSADNIRAGTRLSRRKKVLPGELVNGFETVSTHDQSWVLQILTVLSSLCVISSH